MIYYVADVVDWLKGYDSGGWVVELELEFVEVEMAMAAVENRIGQVLAAEKIIDFGCWVGSLGAHYPGLNVVVKGVTFSFRSERLL